MWFLTPAIVAIVCAIPYLVLCSKVKKPFAVLIMGVVVGLIYLATGQYHILLPLTFFVMAGLAEIIRKLTKYESFWGDAAGYWFFSLSMAASPLPLWVDTDNFLQMVREFGSPESFIETMERYVTPSTLIIIFVGAFAAAVLGSLLVKGMFNKHFVKAGKV